MTADAPRVRQLYANDLDESVKWEGAPRVITREMFRAFSEMTGDVHPIHYDDDYASTTRFGKPLAHGLLLMALTALGATPASHAFEEAIVAFYSQQCRFLAPVFVGDTVTSHIRCRSVEQRPGGRTALVTFDVTLVNQHQVAILEGSHAYIIRCRDV